MSTLTTCALCPRLCRAACPVAVGSGREAAVPAQIAGFLLVERDSEDAAALAAEAVGLCVDCGACEAHCHLSVPLPALLRLARARLLPEPPMSALQPIEGQGDWVVVETDERPFARAMEHHLGQPVRRWRTDDRLGVAAVEHPGWARQARLIREVIGSSKVLVADGGVAHSLERSEVQFSWLHQVVDAPAARSSCRAAGQSAPLACCGGAGALASHHPEDAARLGRWWHERAEPMPHADSRCRDHLNRGGAAVTDLVDWLVDALL